MQGYSAGFRITPASIAIIKQKSPIRGSKAYFFFLPLILSARASSIILSLEREGLLLSIFLSAFLKAAFCFGLIPAIVSLSCFLSDSFLAIYLPFLVVGLPAFFLQAPLQLGFEQPQPHDLHILISLSCEYDAIAFQPQHLVGWF